MYTFNVLASDRSRKKNGRESYVSFYTQYGVSSRFLAKRRYFRSTFWSTLYTLISVLGHAFIEKEREHVQAILWRFCNDIYIYICKYIFTRHMWSKIQIQNNVYLVVENWSIVGKRYSFETLLREIHLRPDVGEWTRTLCKKLER